MPEIFQYDFMIRAFLAGILIALIAPTIGTFLVVRRYSLMSDTLAHVSLVGVAIGVLLGLHPVLTAAGVTVLAALAMERLRRDHELFGESILALFLSGSLAIASVLLSFAHGWNMNLLSLLFGSISTVQTADLWVMGVLGFAVLGSIILFYKEFFLISFNEELAEASGLNVRGLNMLLVMFAAVTVAIAMRIVGILLIGALMVIPVMTAMLYRRSFQVTMMLAVGFSLAAVLAGITVSYYADLVSGGTIVVIALLVFFVSLGFNRRVRGSGVS
ncbi:MAG: metal ABC transporter permease [Patescibacteria group bacterium]